MIMNAPPPFPVKLYELLEDAGLQGFEDVISWQSSGRSFAIHQPQVFQEHILPNFFYKQSAQQQKYKSWIRQLNNYGFRKIKMGSHKGGYGHPNFIRGRAELLQWVNRLSKTPPIDNSSGQTSSTVSVQGQPSVVTGSQNPQRPNRLSQDLSDPFFLQQFSDSNCLSSVSSICDDDQDASLNRSLETMLGCDLDDAPTDIIDDFLHMVHADLQNEQTDPHEGPAEAVEDETTKYITTTSTANDIARASTTSTATCPYHDDDEEEEEEMPADNCPDLMTYEDVSTSTATLPNHEEEELPDDNCPDVVTSEDVSFPVKLYMMLENAPASGYADIVSWVKDGAAFKVHDHGRFVAFVLPFYFNQSKYESFRRQLSHYKFQRVARGPDRGVISHPQLVAGAKAMCRNIQRCVQPP